MYFVGIVVWWIWWVSLSDNKKKCQLPIWTQAMIILIISNIDFATHEDIHKIEHRNCPLKRIFTSTRKSWHCLLDPIVPKEVITLFIMKIKWLIGYSTKPVDYLSPCSQLPTSNGSDSSPGSLMPYAFSDLIRNLYREPGIRSSMVTWNNNVYYVETEWKLSTEIHLEIFLKALFYIKWYFRFSRYLKTTDSIC